MKVSAPSLHREDHHQTLEEMSVFLSVAQCFIKLGIRTDSQKEEHLYVSRHRDFKAHKKPITSVPCSLDAQLQAFNFKKLVRLIQT